MDLLLGSQKSLEPGVRIEESNLDFIKFLEALGGSTDGRSDFLQSLRCMKLRIQLPILEQGSSPVFTSCTTHLIPVNNEDAAYAESFKEICSLLHCASPNLWSRLPELYVTKCPNAKLTTSCAIVIASTQSSMEFLYRSWGYSDLDQYTMLSFVLNNLKNRYSNHAIWLNVYDKESIKEDLKEQHGLIHDTEAEKIEDSARFVYGEKFTQPTEEVRQELKSYIQLG